jgi:hypothetical protein
VVAFALTLGRKGLSFSATKDETAEQQAAAKQAVLNTARRLILLPLYLID